MTLNHSESILIICTSHSELGETGGKTGYWFEELAAPYRVFGAAGFRSTLASPKGGLPPLDPGSNSPDFRTEDVIKFEADQAATAALKSTKSLTEISDLSDYAAVFLVGGHGTMWDFPTNSELGRILALAVSADKPIGAVCHGVAGLLSVDEVTRKGLLDGKKLTSFSNAEETAVGLTDVVPFLLEDRLKENGASYNSSDVFLPNVIVDGVLVTGQNPASSSGAAQALVKLAAEKNGR